MNKKEELDGSVCLNISSCRWLLLRVDEGLIPLCFCPVASEVSTHFNNQISFLVGNMSRLLWVHTDLYMLYHSASVPTQYECQACTVWLSCFSSSRGCRHSEESASLHIPKGNGWLWYRNVVLLWFCSMPVVDPKIYGDFWVKEKSPRQGHIWSDSLGLDTISSNRGVAVCKDSLWTDPESVPCKGRRKVHQDTSLSR